jgi:hypothetical protein
MWEFFQGYGIWMLLAIVAFYLFAGTGGHGGGIGCGGHGSRSHRRGDRRPPQREQEDERDDATVGSSRHGRPHHERHVV